SVELAARALTSASRVRSWISRSSPVAGSFLTARAVTDLPPLAGLALFSVRELTAMIPPEQGTEHDMQTAQARAEHQVWRQRQQQHRSAEQHECHSHYRHDTYRMRAGCRDRRAVNAEPDAGQQRHVAAQEKREGQHTADR